jgi:cytochrome c553
MTHKFILSLALLLVATVSVTTPACAESASHVDYRIAIDVTQPEKNQVLTEMREFLHDMHAMHLALARQDKKAVALIARSMGGVRDRIPVKLKERLPEEFTQLTLAMTEALKILARDAENGADTSKTHENTAEVITYCSGCHDTYRFNVIPLKTKK